MQEKPNGDKGTFEQGFTGAPDVTRKQDASSQQINLVPPIIVAVAVIVVIVGVIFLLRGKATRWHAYKSSPTGLATQSVSLEIPPEWQIREEGTTQAWGTRILWAAPEPKLAAGESRPTMGTELQVSCSKIPQGQPLKQFVDALSQSRLGSTIEVKPIDVGGLQGFLVTQRQVQQQQTLYVSPSEDGAMYTLKLACRPDEYDALKPTFERVIASFRIGG